MYVFPPLRVHGLGRASRGFSRAVLCALAITALTASSGWAAVASRSEYRLVITSTFGAPDRPTVTRSEFTLTAYELGAVATKHQVIYTVLRENGTGLPVGSLIVNGRGEARMELSHPRDVELTSALMRLFGIRAAVPVKRLEELRSGQEHIELPARGLRTEVPVNYSTEIAGDEEDRVAYSVTLAGEPLVTKLGSAELKLESVDQRLLFDAADHRLLSGSWSSKLLRTIRGNPRRNDRTVEILELARRPLAGPEKAQLLAEYRKLLPLARATLPGKQHGNSSKSIRTKLESFKTKYGNGLLKDTLPELEVLIAQKLQDVDRPLNPDVLADKLIGKPAPDFTLRDLEGSEVTLSSFKGKVVLVVFWGYICGICRGEAPELSALQQRFGKQGFQVLAVNADNDPKERIQGFVDRAGLKQTMLMQGNGVATAVYHVRGFPTKYWIDRTGKIIARKRGYEEPAKMRQRVEELLRK